MGVARATCGRGPPSAVLQPRRCRPRLPEPARRPPRSPPTRPRIVAPPHVAELERDPGPGTTGSRPGRPARAWCLRLGVLDIAAHQGPVHRGRVQPGQGRGSLRALGQLHHLGQGAVDDVQRGPELACVGPDQRENDLRVPHCERPGGGPVLQGRPGEALGVGEIAGLQPRHYAATPRTAAAPVPEPASATRAVASSAHCARPSSRCQRPAAIEPGEMTRSARSPSAGSSRSSAQMHRGAEVVEVVDEPLAAQARRAPRRSRSPPRSREGDVVLPAWRAGADGVGLVTLVEALAGVLPQGLEHRYRVVSDRGSRTHHRLRDQVGRARRGRPTRSTSSPAATASAAAEVEAAGEHAEAVEDALRSVGSSRSSTTSRPSPAGSGGARPRCRRPPVSSRNRSSSRSSDLGGRIDRDPGRRELDGERDPVEAAADLGDGRGVVVVEHEVAPGRPGPGRRTAAPAVGGRIASTSAPRRERRACAPRTIRSPATPSASRLVASTATCGHRASTSSTSRPGGVEQVLAVVEHEQQALAAERYSSTASRASATRASGDPPASATTVCTRRVGVGDRRRARTATRRRGSGGATSAATWTARRVLPTPPTPVSVTSRRVAQRAGDRVDARASRPTNDVALERAGCRGTRRATAAAGTRSASPGR